MAYDDLDVIVYKTLAYILACAKADVAPSIHKAKEVSKANDTLWAMAVESMVRNGLIVGVNVEYYYDGEGKPNIGAGPGFGITMEGQQHLRDNSKMREVAQFLGQAFQAALPLAVTVTQAL